MSTYLRHVIRPICLTPIESERFTVIIYLFSVKMLSFLASKIISFVRFSSSPKRNYSPAGRNVTTPHTLAKQRGRKKEEKGVTKNGHRSSSLCRHKASRSYETGSGSAKGSVQFFSPSPRTPCPLASTLVGVGSSPRLTEWCIDQFHGPMRSWHTGSDLLSPFAAGRIFCFFFIKHIQ